MQVETIPEMALSDADEAGIAQLLSLSFDTDFGNRSFYKQRHHLRLIIRADAQIIGHMALCFRAIRMGDALVDIVGLAEVATHPDHRKQGIASKLMQDAVAQAKASCADFFILFGDQPLYAASGFVPKPNTMTFVVMDDARTHRIMSGTDDGLMVMSLRDQSWDSSAPIDLLGPMF